MFHHLSTCYIINGLSRVVYTHAGQDLFCHAQSILVKDRSGSCAVWRLGVSSMHSLSSCKPGGFLPYKVYTLQTRRTYTWQFILVQARRMVGSLTHGWFSIELKSSNFFRLVTLLMYNCLGNERFWETWSSHPTQLLGGMPSLSRPSWLRMVLPNLARLFLSFFCWSWGLGLPTLAHLSEMIRAERVRCLLEIYCWYNSRFWSGRSLFSPRDYNSARYGLVFSSFFILRWWPFYHSQWQESYFEWEDRLPSVVSQP